MAQGTHVSSNLLHDNVSSEDLFVEVDHGPFLVDNNLFLSPVSLLSLSRGGAYAHNLFAGAMNIVAYDARQTPYLKAHSTEVAGLHDNPKGDDRYDNNLFAGRADLRPYDESRLPVRMDGNVFLAGASPSRHEPGPLRKPEFDPSLRLEQTAEGFFLALTAQAPWSPERTREPVTTERLGRTAIANLPYELPDGSEVRVSTDYFGKPRNVADPAPGPFEDLKPGRNTLKVW
jgi:alpha-N-arabinofuranosidase